MAHWWHYDVIAGEKLPLMLCFLGFVVTIVMLETRPGGLGKDLLLHRLASST